MTVDSLLNEFDVTEFADDKKKTEFTSLTIWVPVEFRDKYVQIQRSSKRRFGKFLKKLVLEAIDRVKLSA